ncbi:MAG TPA: glycosyl hydrolase family 18 protein [Kofleriaceae bacterium]|jgi:hypothetical protein|nr:glycosyl hydrolase family 18 protein [Kofleriaceae bacterium]
MSLRARSLSVVGLALSTTLISALPGCTDELPSEPDAGAPSPVAAVGPWSVYLRTELTGHYLTAINAGGAAVQATAPAPREWENFQLVDANGGHLVDGDEVFLRAYDGTHYLQAEWGGGGGMNVTGLGMWDWEAFRIERVAGPGEVRIGDTIALRTRLTGQYVTAQNGGGGSVAATAPRNDLWEHFILSGSSGDNPPPLPPPPPPTRKRVIGYLPNWYGSYAEWANRIDFAKVTHINLAFALGDDNGNLQLASSADLAAFVNAAHARGVKVYPSLCGGGGDGRITPHYQPGRVDAFVDKIIAFVRTHNMDGIDVDVEAPDRMGAVYDTFIAKLRAKAAPLGLPVTAAVAPWMQHGMSDATLRSFDFITVMSYDNTGTWTGPGEHSSYQQAVSALDFYSARGVARDKIVLGVPFYGYCWGNCGNGQSSTYILYKDLLARFPDAWSTDWIDRDGARYSFNGVATMQAKTRLGNQYGGIMIWELGGDVATSHPRSLLSAIDGAR